MSAPPPAASGQPTLGHVLRRAHVALAFGAVAVVGLVLAVPAIATVHYYAGHDLRLLSRAIGDTVQAAVVFGDSDAAQEALLAIVTDEDLAEATVSNLDGRILAVWRDETTGWEARIAAATARLLHEKPVVLPITHDGAVIGQVRVFGGGRTLLHFLAVGAFGIVVCQVLIAAGALYLSRRLVRQIVRPLQALADVAGTVQRERAFARRVPAAAIAELDDLGHSFNGLLAELDAWQNSMEGENRRLSHQATHDSLTGVANRAFFEGRLNRALMGARKAGTAVAVMLIDCDKFKDINDGYGHAAGDAVLVGVASRLKGQCREHDLVARLGGDEFAVLIAPSHDAAGLRHMADAISAAMQIPLQVRDGLSVTMTLSVGIATFPGDANDAMSLLQFADESMYEAKRTSVGRPANALAGDGGTMLRGQR